MFLLLWTSAYGQLITYPNPNDSTIIQIKELYKGYGKTFDSKNILSEKFLSLCLLSPFQTFNLKDKEIIKLEELFLSNYNLNGKHKNRRLLKKNIRKFSDFHRQYICYLSKKGEKEVEIIFINSKIISDWEISSDLDYFIRANWKVCPQYGHGFSNNEMFRYWVNLDTSVVFVKFD